MYCASQRLFSSPTHRPHDYWGQGVTGGAQKDPNVTLVGRMGGAKHPGFHRT